MYTKQDLKEILDELYELYYRGDLGAQGVFFHNKCCTISEIQDSIEVNIDFDKERNIKRIERMIEIDDNRDIDRLLLLREIYFELVGHDISLLRYERIIPKYIKKNFRYINNEIERFDSFKDNQNLFDNILSLIKITRNFNISRDTNKEIKINQLISNDFDIEYCVKDLKGQVLEDLNHIRFMI